ncbi:transposable element Tcb1 transposase [Trichonephila clavipes]|nr:transposable element Tcb1 transposase [Trichonephila clavipes]
MVWAGISLGYRTDLKIFKRGSVTAVRYRVEVLEPIVRLYAAAVGPTFVLMDDNARPHKTGIVDDYLESKGIAHMAWPAYSPDLNPIENLWDALCRAVSLRFPPPATFIEMETALQEEWGLLNSAVVDHLIESMARSYAFTVHRLWQRFLERGNVVSLKGGKVLVCQTYGKKRDPTSYFFCHFVMRALDIPLLISIFNRISAIQPYLWNPQHVIMVGGRKMEKKALALQAICLVCCMLLEPGLSEQPLSNNQDHAPKTSTNTVEHLKNDSSVNTTTEHSIMKSAAFRNRRDVNSGSKQFSFQEGNRVLDPVFQYNDQIMRNLLQNHSPKPLNYARSHFFLNLLRPLDRRTRYNAWDDHSVMHFGKRSVSLTDSNIDKEINGSDSKESDVEQLGNKENPNLDKRSLDSWTDHNVMHFGKRSGEESGSEIVSDINKKEIETLDGELMEKRGMIHSWKNNLMNDLNNWRNVKIGKKFEIPWSDHSTMHFGKRDDDPWHSMMSFGKRAENPFSDHNTMHFGKREDDPWHNMMSFGKRGENPFSDHSTMHFGKRDDEPWHNMMSFGKRAENPFSEHSTMHFGKRDDEPWHNMMSFGKRAENPFSEHSTMHFGKRDDEPGTT